MGYILMLAVALSVLAWSITHRPDETLAPVMVEAIEEPSPFVSDGDFDAMCAEREKCRGPEHG